MIAIKNSKFNKMTIKLIVSIGLLIAVTALFFKLTVLNIILLATASPVLLWLALRVVDPMIKRIILKYHKDHNPKRRFHLKINKDKTPFYFNKRKHVVYAYNKTAASKIFNDKIKPYLRMNPYKSYEYISKECNNLNNEY